MSNISLFQGAAVPAFARQAPAGAVTIGKSLAGSAQGGKRISIKGGVFRLVDAGKEIAAVDERHLDVVIVNAAQNIARTYYAGAYSEDVKTGPDCWSSDGVKPSAQAAKPQSINCVNCPMNQKGSGQGDSRACRYSQRLAVVLANDIEGSVMQLTLAATSIFGKGEGDNRPLQEYARWMMAQGFDPTQVITRMKFDTKAPVPKLFFKPMRWLTQEEYEICQAQGTSEDALKAIEMTVAQTDAVVAAPAPLSIGGTPPAAAKPAPATAPVADEDDPEPPAPEPTKRGRGRPPKAATIAVPEEAEEAPPTVRQAAKPAAAPAANANIANTLAEWDDE